MKHKLEGTWNMNKETKLSLQFSVYTQPAFVIEIIKQFEQRAFFLVNEKAKIQF